jgi:hypothetical protein
MLARVNEYATALGRGNYYGEDAEFEDFICGICLEVPEGGDFALVGCPGAHSACRACILRLRDTSTRGQTTCPFCRQPVGRPTGMEATDKKRAFALAKTTCCMPNCTFTTKVTNLEGLADHMKDEHAGDFRALCPVDGCSWSGTQNTLGGHLEEPDVHTKQLAPCVLSISAAVARLEGTVGLIDAANEATTSLVMQKLEVIITSQAALSASQAALDTALETAAIATAALATAQAGFKRDLEAFRGVPTARVVNPARPPMPILGPDCGFPGGVSSKTMCARRRMRVWWGLDEFAENADDWSVYEEWVHEHYARTAYAGKELRYVQDDGAPSGWEKAWTPKSWSPPRHYYDEVRAKADRKIAEVKAYSNAVAAAAAADYAAAAFE